MSIEVLTEHQPGRRLEYNLTIVFNQNILRFAANFDKVLQENKYKYIKIIVDDDYNDVICIFSKNNEDGFLEIKPVSGKRIGIRCKKLVHFLKRYYIGVNLYCNLILKDKDTYLLSEEKLDNKIIKK